MRKTIIIVIALCLTGLVQAQEQRQPREVWNEVFTKQQGREFPHNKFLAETIKGRKPGRALDIGMGEGRNALFLAAQGREVTGFDISDVGVQLARAAAQRRGLKLQILVDDVDRFDYGRQRWDLVVGMYMHAMITRNAAKISDALKPGGIIVVEGFHRDLNRPGLPYRNPPAFVQSFGESHVTKIRSERSLLWSKMSWGFMPPFRRIVSAGST